MAKDKSTIEVDIVAPNAAQIASATRSVMAIIGCGELDAKTRLKEMEPKRIIEIAELEDANKRKEVVTLLYS